jgi:DNA (cytosine-5)-methyltransferase 1
MGLHRAGFDVVGVDIKPQPRYPFTFVQADALRPPFDLARFDFVWASPPCQGYSALRCLPWLRDREYPMLIEPTRDMLNDGGPAWCMENVERAPLRGFILCGQQFGLPVYRHRKFETSFYCLAPSHNQHRHVIGHGRMLNDRAKGSLNAGSAKGAWGKQTIVTVAGGQFRKADGERALEIDWMHKGELSQAIPPAYSEFIAHQFLAQRIAA